MRFGLTMTAITALAVSLIASAWAQKVWEPAPVPTVGPATVTPADRAGGTSGTDAAGPANGTPFSGPPPEVQPAGPTAGPRAESRPGVQQGTPSTSR